MNAVPDNPSSGALFGGTPPTENRTVELPRLARDTTAENPWPVSVLSRKYHDAVQRWPQAWVRGQIVEINMRRSTSGYVTLRDDTEEISLPVMGFRDFVAKAREFREATGSSSTDVPTSG